MTYIFASLRGEDFRIEGDDPMDAYKKLCEREKDNGSLWKLCDSYRNECAIKHEGFQRLGNLGVVYKVGRNGR